jgi:hypothetical protein
LGGIRGEIRKRLERKYSSQERCRKDEERSRREFVKKTMATSEYWGKFDRLLIRIQNFVVGIGSGRMERDAEIEPLITDVIEIKKWGCLLLEGIWSDSYISLMNIFEKELPQEIFNQLSIANQLAAAAERDGHMRDGESLSYCEKRRRELIEKLEKAVKKMEEVSSKTPYDEQNSYPAD